ncbi:MAG: T9SS type A sorting domain-containing protein [Ignavibacteriaceae bacterium]
MQKAFIRSEQRFLQSKYKNYFTNIGPLVAADTIIFGYYDEWSYLQNFKFTLKNTDTTKAVSDVTVRISADDERINRIGNNYSEFYDLPVKGTSICKTNFSFSLVDDSIKPSIDKENPIKIKLDIYSKNRLLWIDTLDFYYTSLVGIEKSDIIINTFNLYQNYPNPFNPTTKIKYSIPTQSKVMIKVYDILGNELETLVNKENPAGIYELNWNAANLPSGVYFYQLRTGGFIETKKMVLLR